LKRLRVELARTDITMKNVALFCIFLFGIVAAAQQPVPVSSNACHMQ
jgi:hypothetical protein